MTGAIVEKYQQTKAVVQGQITTTRDDIVQKRDEIVDRGRKLRTGLERRRELAVGKLRDESLERLYNVGETAYRNVATLLQKVEQLTPARFNLLAGRSENLLSRAERFNEARGGLHKPVDGYDEMNVTQAKALASTLSSYELEKQRQYEAANKNRVTVLREIERLLSN